MGDRIRQLGVRVNADTPADAHRGRVGARGHRPLCRGPVLRRRAADRDAGDDRGARQGGRERALAKLLPMQRGISKPSSARWRAAGSHCGLDPALHEFLPHDASRGSSALAAGLGWPAEDQLQVVVRPSAARSSSMLGLAAVGLRRSCPPEITAMQVRAIFEAACTVACRKGRVDARGDGGSATRPAWWSSASRR